MYAILLLQEFWCLTRSEKKPYKSETSDTNVRIQKLKAWKFAPSAVLQHLISNSDLVFTFTKVKPLLIFLQILYLQHVFK